MKKLSLFLCASLMASAAYSFDDNETLKKELKKEKGYKWAGISAVSFLGALGTAGLIGFADIFSLCGSTLRGRDFVIPAGIAAFGVYSAHKSANLLSPGYHLVVEKIAGNVTKQ